MSDVIRKGGEDDFGWLYCSDLHRKRKGLVRGNYPISQSKDNVVSA